MRCPHSCSNQSELMSSLQREEKAEMWVWKINGMMQGQTLKLNTKKVFLTVMSGLQFHQHFISSFFVQKYLRSFSVLTHLVFVIFWRKKICQKASSKNLFFNSQAFNIRKCKSFALNLMMLKNIDNYRYLLVFYLAYIFRKTDFDRF